jgi:hypothetical protein
LMPVRIDCHLQTFLSASLCRGITVRAHSIHSMRIGQSTD